MDPRILFPILAVVFFALAGWKALRTRSWNSPVSTWALLGFIFGAVSLWLHLSNRGA